MKAKDIQDYLKSLNGGWVDYAKSVDSYKAGSPETEVQGIATGWMSYLWALKEAVRMNCNVFITHEPTYYGHLDRKLDMESLAILKENKLSSKNMS